MLEDVKRVAENGAKSKNLTEAVAAINKFFREIRAADDVKTDNLVVELVNALKKVEYTIDCLKKKTKSIKKIRTSCERGDDDLKKLFDKVVKDEQTNGNCVSEVTAEVLLDYQKNFVSELDLFFASLFRVVFHTPHLRAWRRLSPNIQRSFLLNVTAN